MMPDNVLSTIWIRGTYVGLDTNNPLPAPLFDYEEGGVDIQDPSLGLKGYLWKVEIVNNSVYISKDGGPNRLMFTRSNNISEVSLAFDQNMNPFVAFVETGNDNIPRAWFWWFDTTVLAQVFTQLPEGSITPRATLDDKRSLAFLSSDIILGYLRQGTLFIRVQRDRYLIEYPLYYGLDGRLIKIGMNNRSRLQFQILPN